MPMKHTLRYCFVLLAIATTGLFASAATEPVPTAAAGHHKTIKSAKKGKKGHKKHAKKHRKHRHKGSA